MSIEAELIIKGLSVLILLGCNILGCSWYMLTTSISLDRGFLLYMFPIYIQIKLIFSFKKRTQLKMATVPKNIQEFIKKLCESYDFGEEELLHVWESCKRTRKKSDHRTGYQLFMKEEKKKIKGEDFENLISQISYRWKQLSKTEKDKYSERALIEPVTRCNYVYVKTSKKNTECGRVVESEGSLCNRHKPKRKKVDESESNY